MALSLTPAAATSCVQINATTPGGQFNYEFGIAAAGLDFTEEEALALTDLLKSFAEARVAGTEWAAVTISEIVRFVRTPLSTFQESP